MFDLNAIQAAIGKFGFDGWLMYDFRNSNPLVRRILGMDTMPIGSRRFYYWIPAKGSPRKLVHRIEPGALDHLPGERTIYLRWSELEAGVASLVGTGKRVAMEYSPRGNIPYMGRVDAGTIELVRSTGCEIVSSGDLIQLFEAAWSDEQWELHLRAEQGTTTAYDAAWKFVAERVREGGSVHEMEVQDVIMKHFHGRGLTAHHAPIVGVNAHSADPHYEPRPGDAGIIREGDFLLIDLWAKVDHPAGVYSDLTRVGFLGKTVPEKFQKIFKIVAAARDAAISLVKTRIESRTEVRGWEVDDACRAVIEKAGYGDRFLHRTGHSIGREVHGNGANIDNLETREDRLLLPRTCFSVEPGIYLEGEFGCRSEIDVYIRPDQTIYVSGGPLQYDVLPVLA